MAKRRQRRLPRQRFPRSIEREYVKQLELIVAKTEKALRPLFAALPGLLEPREDARADASDEARVRALIAQVKRKLAKSLSQKPLEKLAKRFGRRTSRNVTEQLRRQIRSIVGADVFASDPKALAKILKDFDQTNIKFMRDLSRELVADIEKRTINAIKLGRRHEVVAKELAGRLGVSERRAKLIARDQVGKLYGQVNQARQQALGVKQFIWRTQNDERVRPSHRAREGVTYSYSDPPSGELPGQPVLCRCYAEPVIDELEGI